MPWNGKCTIIGYARSSKSQQYERKGVVYSSALKSFSFSTWAVSKASLKALASIPMVSECLNKVGIKKLTLAVSETDGQGLSLRLTLRDIGGGVPDPAAVTADVGAQLHVGHDWKIHISTRSSLGNTSRGGSHCSGWRRP